uniref:Uncharacterized protein n=1 Tax=Arundo donax TaxID=35708 RepID=A0A0A9BSP0_ARUDO
MKPIDTNRRG